MASFGGGGPSGPIKVGSSVDMWRDEYPPQCDRDEWTFVRDTLYRCPDERKEMAKCMNVAQEAYIGFKDTVAMKGRQFGV